MTSQPPPLPPGVPAQSPVAPDQPPPPEQPPVAPDQPPPPEQPPGTSAQPPGTSAQPPGAPSALPRPPALPPGQPPGPQGPPGGRRPAPPDPAKVARTTRAFTAWLAGTALLSLFPFPWNLAAFPFAVLAVVVGIRAVVEHVRARTRTFTVGLIAAGVAFCGMVVLSLAGSAILWTPQMDRQECLARALTIAAQEQCEKQFTEDVQRWQDGLVGRLTSD